MSRASPLKSKDSEGLAAVDDTREADRPAIEPSLEMRDGEHAVLQGRGDLGVAERHGRAADAGHGDLQRAVDALQRRAERLRLEAGHGCRPWRRGSAAAQPAEVEHVGPEIGGNDGLAA